MSFKHIFRHSIALLLLAVPATTWAADDDDDTPKWSLSGQLGATKNVVTRNATGEKPADWGFSHGLTAEYYFMDGQLSALAGASWEEYSFFNSDVSNNTTQLRLGGRWYPLAYETWVNPYVGADFLTSFSHSTDDSWMAMESPGYSYSRTMSHRPPLFSVAPVVGVEFKLLSSVWLTADYSYRLGVSGRTDVTTFNAKKQPIGEAHSPLSRHAISVGLKLKFPFRLTQKDVNCLLDALLETIFYTKDERNYRRRVNY